jgi:pilus assembly protein Flp/PilA
MNALVQRVKSFLVSEDGPTATEYAVMLALIIVACIAAITALGGALKGTFENLTGNLPDGNPPA